MLCDVVHQMGHDISVSRTHNTPERSYDNFIYIIHLHHSLTDMIWACKILCRRYADCWYAKSPFCRIWNLIRGELCHLHWHRRTVSPQPNCIRDLYGQQVLTDQSMLSLFRSLSSNVLGWCKEVCMILDALNLDGTYGIQRCTEFYSCIVNCNYKGLLLLIATINWNSR